MSSVGSTAEDVVAQLLVLNARLESVEEKSPKKDLYNHIFIRVAGEEVTFVNKAQWFKGIQARRMGIESLNTAVVVDKLTKLENACKKYTLEELTNALNTIKASNDPRYKECQEILKRSSGEIEITQKAEHLRDGVNNIIKHIDVERAEAQRKKRKNAQQLVNHTVTFAFKSGGSQPKAQQLPTPVTIQQTPPSPKIEKKTGVPEQKKPLPGKLNKQQTEAMGIRPMGGVRPPSPTKEPSQIMRKEETTESVIKEKEQSKILQDIRKERPKIKQDRKPPTRKQKQLVEPKTVAQPQKTEEEKIIVSSGAEKPALSLESLRNQLNIWKNQDHRLKEFESNAYIYLVQNAEMLLTEKTDMEEVHTFFAELPKLLKEMSTWRTQDHGLEQFESDLYTAFIEQVEVQLKPDTDMSTVRSLFQETLPKLLAKFGKVRNDVLAELAAKEEMEGVEGLYAKYTNLMEECKGKITGMYKGKQTLEHIEGYTEELTKIQKECSGLTVIKKTVLEEELSMGEIPLSMSEPTSSQAVVAQFFANTFNVQFPQGQESGEAVKNTLLTHFKDKKNLEHLNKKIEEMEKDAPDAPPIVTRPEWSEVETLLATAIQLHSLSVAGGSEKEQKYAQAVKQALGFCEFVCSTVEKATQMLSKHGAYTEKEQSFFEEQESGAKRNLSLDGLINILDKDVQKEARSISTSLENLTWEEQQTTTTRGTRSTPPKSTTQSVWREWT